MSNSSILKSKMCIKYFMNVLKYAVARCLGPIYGRLTQAGRVFVHSRRKILGRMRINFDRGRKA